MSYDPGIIPGIRKPPTYTPPPDDSAPYGILPPPPASQPSSPPPSSSTPSNNSGGGGGGSSGGSSSGNNNTGGNRGANLGTYDLNKNIVLGKNANIPTPSVPVPSDVQASATQNRNTSPSGSGKVNTTNNVSSPYIPGTQISTVQFQSELQQQETNRQQYLSSFKDINPVFKGGSSLISVKDYFSAYSTSRYLENMGDITKIPEKSFGSPISSWDPNTKVVKINEGGYSVSFPYEGAQYYKEYSDILSAHPETAWTRMFLSPTLNVDLALASPGYERNKILVQYLQSTKGSPTGGADFWRGTQAVMNSPWVQIAGSYAAGKALGVGVKAGSSYFASKAIAGGISVSRLGLPKLIGYGAAVGVAGLTAKDLYTSYETEGFGAALGRGITTGASFASFSSGYSGISKSVKTQDKFWAGTDEGATPLRIVREGKEINTLSQLKYIESKGVPTERTLVRATESSLFKPGDIKITAEPPVPEGLSGYKVMKGTPIIKTEMTDTGLDTVSRFTTKGRSFFEYVSKPFKTGLGGRRILTAREVTFTEKTPGEPFGGITKQIEETMPSRSPFFKNIPELKPMFSFDIAPRNIVGKIPFISVNRKRDISFSFDSRNIQNVKYPMLMQSRSPTVDVVSLNKGTNSFNDIVKANTPSFTQKKAQMQNYDFVSQSVAKSKPDYLFVSPSLKIPYFNLQKEFTGASGGTADRRLFGNRYRFREFNIPSIDKLMKGIKI